MKIVNHKLILSDAIGKRDEKKYLKLAIDQVKSLMWKRGFSATSLNPDKLGFYIDYKDPENDKKRAKELGAAIKAGSGWEKLVNPSSIKVEGNKIFMKMQPVEKFIEMFKRKGY